MWYVEELRQECLMFESAVIAQGWSAFDGAVGKAGAVDVMDETQKVSTPLFMLQRTEGSSKARGCLATVYAPVSRLEIEPVVHPRLDMVVPHSLASNDIATINGSLSYAANGSMEPGCDDTLGRARRSSYAKKYHIC